MLLVTNALLIWQIYKSIYVRSADKLITDKDKAEKRKKDAQLSLIGIVASAVYAVNGIKSIKTLGKPAKQNDAKIVDPGLKESDKITRETLPD